MNKKDFMKELEHQLKNIQKDESSFNIDFKSVSGDVSTEFPLIIEESSNNVLKGKKGESDVVVNVHTVSGNFVLN